MTFDHMSVLFYEKTTFPVMLLDAFATPHEDTSHVKVKMIINWKQIFVALL